jgi:hypothetical protein
MNCPYRSPFRILLFNLLFAMWRRGAVAFVYGGSDSRLSMVTWAIVNLERVEKHYKRPNADRTLFEMGPDELGGKQANSAPKSE